MEEIKKRLRELRSLIDLHDHRYYVLAEPSVSDSDYDALHRELLDLEKAYPELITPDSPTQRVGSDITKVFSPIVHRIPMLSLANTYNEGELIDFDRRVREGLPESEILSYVTEYKIDGVSICLRYRAGKLFSAATRGDGTTGDEVTANVKTIRSVPLKIPIEKITGENLSDIEVRGEIYIENKAFEQMNERQEAAGERIFMNPRNAAAGTLKQLVPKTVSQRPLQIFVYSLLAEDTENGTQAENLELLKQLGFRVNSSYRVCSSIAEVIAVCRETEELRDSLPFTIDGVVIKVNSLRHQALLGAIAKSPRWAVAFKFKAKQAETMLRSIVWQVGRNGTLTPVAELTPVLLAGSMISRATLHNYDEISRKDIREGDTVIIEKGGDVIPKITGIVKEKRSPESELTVPPNACPVCEGPIVKPDEEVAYYCENAACPAQTKRRIEHFASRTGMDIESLGESNVDLLVEQNFLSSYADIYELQARTAELVELPRFGKKSVDRLLAAIEKSKKQPFNRLLYALGIRYVGEGAALKLAEAFGSMDALMNASEEDIQKVSEIGPKISAGVKTFFTEEKNAVIIEKLRRCGLCFFQSAKQTKDNALFSGKVFVLTGTLKKYTRTEAGELIQRFGGKTASSVGKKVNFVIAGEEAGSKLEKAQELNIPILTEDEFLSLVKKAEE